MNRETKLLTVDYLFEILTCKDGKLFWKERRVKTAYDKIFNTKFSGKEAGSKNNDGRLRIVINKVQYQSHRIIFFMVNGYVPDILDHLDGNPLNNNPENIVESSMLLNARNRCKPKNNKSGHKNIRFKQGRFEVNVRKDFKQKFIGSFDDINDAIKARDTFKINNGNNLRDLNG